MVFEMSLINKNQLDNQIYKYIVKLLKQANSYIRKYVMVSEDLKHNKIFDTTNYTKCNMGTKFFNQKHYQLLGTNEIIDADTVVIVDTFSDKQAEVLAAAGFCQKGQEQFSIVGRMSINTELLVPNPKSYFQNYSQMMTVVHEIFHIIAFSNNKKEKLRMIDKPALRELMAKNNIFDDNGDHWNPIYIPNDLMVPMERYDAILTIFSLELIETSSKLIKTNRKYMQNNFTFDSNDPKKIIDPNEVDCEKEEDIPSKFATQICTKSQIGSYGCDSSYIYKTYCTDITMNKKKNCYQRIVINSSICSDETNQIESSKGSKGKKNLEVFSAESRCFEFNFTKNNKKQQKALCLQFNIAQSQGVEVLFSKETPLMCKKGTQSKNPQINFMGDDIEIKCPNFELFENAFKMTKCPNFCHGNGFCVNGECVCFDGFEVFNNCKTEINEHETENFFMVFF